VAGRPFIEQDIARFRLVAELKDLFTSVMLVFAEQKTSPVHCPVFLRFLIYLELIFIPFDRAEMLLAIFFPAAGAATEIPSTFSK
jgi:uncharacterized membrane protein